MRALVAQGKSAESDALRIEIRAMSTREADLLARYSDAANEALRRNLWVDAIASLLTLVTGIAAFSN